MASPLPPLAAIRAFEAVARHASFTRAAKELGMTQAAVSYQIKVLEDRIGAPLFLRRPRQIVLTDAGRKLAPAATEAFDLIRTAYAAARGGDQSTLVVNTIPTFASNWLARNIGSFQIAHPTLAVRIETSPGLVDFGREDVDVAIRSGHGKWPGLVAHHLLIADFTPMLSPRLAESIGGIGKPADLMKLPIISPNDPWWTIWFEAAGVPTEGLRNRPTTLLGSQSYEGSAAIAGQGVGILTPAFFADELAEERLLQPFDLRCDDGQAYWLVYPEARWQSPKIAAFRDWVLSRLRSAPPAAR